MIETKITDVQIQRVEVAIQELARRNNAWGIGISKQLTGKPIAEKRRIILGSIGQMWEAMLSIRMAMESTRTPEEIAASLKASMGKSL